MSKYSLTKHEQRELKLNKEVFKRDLVIIVKGFVC